MRGHQDKGDLERWGAGGPVSMVVSSLTWVAQAPACGLSSMVVLVLLNCVHHSSGLQEQVFPGTGQKLPVFKNDSPSKISQNFKLSYLRYVFDIFQICQRIYSHASNWCSGWEAPDPTN